MSPRPYLVRVAGDEVLEDASVRCVRHGIGLSARARVWSKREARGKQREASEREVRGKQEGRKRGARGEKEGGEGNRQKGIYNILAVTLVKECRQRARQT